MSDSNSFNRLPPLKALKGFEATVRLGGIGKAADELHITPPAITHQIHNLEQSLQFQISLNQIPLFCL